MNHGLNERPAKGAHGVPGPSGGQDEAPSGSVHVLLGGDGGSVHRTHSTVAMTGDKDTYPFFNLFISF